MLLCFGTNYLKLDGLIYSLVFYGLCILYLDPDYFFAWLVVYREQFFVNNFNKFTSYTLNLKIQATRYRGKDVDIDKISNG